LVKLSLDDIFWPVSALWPMCWDDRPSSKFHSPLPEERRRLSEGLRGVRNADDWPVGAQIGHSAVKRIDDVIQTEFNELTEQWRRGLFNVQHLRTLGPLAYTVDRQLTDRITCCTR